MQIGNFGNENAVRNTFARMANVPSVGEIGEAAVAKLRGVGKLHNSEEEVEIAEKQ